MDNSTRREPQREERKRRASKDDEDAGEVRIKQQIRVAARRDVEELPRNDHQILKLPQVNFNFLDDSVLDDQDSR